MYHKDTCHKTLLSTSAEKMNGVQCIRRIFLSRNLYGTSTKHLIMKKALRETQTLRALWLFGHRPPATNTPTNTQTGPITIHCAAT